MTDPIPPVAALASGVLGGRGLMVTTLALVVVLAAILVVSVREVKVRKRLPMPISGRWVPWAQSGARGRQHRLGHLPRRLTRRRRAWRPPSRSDPHGPVSELVRRFVVVPSGRTAMESRLPVQVLARCAFHSSFFHGRCVRGTGYAQLIVRATALRGFGHAFEETAGQDAVAATWDDRRGALYLAVADGLGSLADSGAAAARAANRAVELCRRRPSGLGFDVYGPQLFLTIAAELRSMLSADPSSADPRPPRQGATTLAVAEVRPVADGAVVSACAVGDSEVWLLHGERWDVLHHERDEAAGNATRELPRHPQPHVVSEVRLATGSVLLLATDGFAGALGTERSPLAWQLARCWTAPPAPLEFVNQVDFVDDYWTDDRAAVAVWVDSTR